MNYKSYLDKVFVVESSKAIIRNDRLEEQRYVAGEVLPPGKHVGDVKTVPQRTEVKVTDVKTDSGRHTYVFVAPANGGEPFGWTAAMNLEGGFKNETAGLSPSQWELEPLGTNKTCIDRNALIREGSPNFTSLGSKIPIKSFVAVRETSGDFVRVSKMTIVQNAIEIGEDIGWTKASNLHDGCSDLYFSDDWTSTKGPNACWRRGEYLGPKLLVNIVGFGGEMEQITLDSLDPYMKLKNAAEEDNVQLSINSAFRTFQRQAQLRRLFEAGQGNRAAPPGHSNHQHGQAFDLNTRHNVFDGTDKVYEWLKANAPKHGFVRAVSDESWHWEYRPVEAEELAAAGSFKIPGVEDHA